MRDCGGIGADRAVLNDGSPWTLPGQAGQKPGFRMS